MAPITLARKLPIMLTYTRPEDIIQGRMLPWPNTVNFPKVTRHETGQNGQLKLQQSGGQLTKSYITNKIVAELKFGIRKIGHHSGQVTEIVNFGGFTVFLILHIVSHNPNSTTF